MAGDVIFENEWQSFHTKKPESGIKNSVLQVQARKVQGSGQVVDIFGNDMMKILLRWVYDGTNGSS